MLKLRRTVIFAALITLVAIPAFANNFRAADLVYLPAVASTPGGGGSFFKTDVFISNISGSTVDVDIAFAPTGGGDNTSALLPANMRRITLAPGERREVIDILASLFGQQGLGQLLFFACRQGGNCDDCDADSSDCELITVQGRIYTEGGGNACPQAAPNCTFGQLFSGIPWYNFASGDDLSTSLGYDSVFMAGIRQGTAFRSNVGITNASTDYSMVLRIRLFSNSGQPVGTAERTLGPLGHIQANVAALFPGFSGNGFVVVDQTSSTRVTPVTEPPSEAPIPGFFAYASMVDNVSNDPTTLEAQFNQELPFACVYGDASKNPQSRLRRPAAVVR